MSSKFNEEIVRPNSMVIICNARRLLFFVFFLKKCDEDEFLGTGPTVYLFLLFPCFSLFVDTTRQNLEEKRMSYPSPSNNAATSSKAMKPVINETTQISHSAGTVAAMEENVLTAQVKWLQFLH